MGTFIFQPSQQGPFVFQPILDGVAYQGIVKWNTFGQRWYLELDDGSGNEIFNKALIGSTDGIEIQSMTWAQNTVTIVTAEPHGYDIGQTLDLTVAGATPAAYNGVQQMLVTGINTLTFPLSANPGVASTLGTVIYNIDLLWSYDFDSTMVFRESSQTFEVSP
jgi:hypothetical protein